MDTNRLKTMRASSMMGILSIFVMAAPAFAQQESFVMPSGNVECTFTPRGGTAVYMPKGGGPELSCDRVEPSYVRVIMGPRGATQLIRNVGDASCCGTEPKLAYGSVWRRAPFTCESTQAGLECRRDDGAGFAIARRGVTLR